MGDVERERRRGRRRRRHLLRRPLECEIERNVVSAPANDRASEDPSRRGYPIVAWWDSEADLNGNVLVGNPRGAARSRRRGSAGRRSDQPLELVLRTARCCGREQERIFARCVAVRRARGTRCREPGVLLRRARRADVPVVSSRGRGRRAARVRQRLPAPRLDRRRGRGQARRRCSARTTRGRTGSTAGCARAALARELRLSARGRARAGAARALGAVRVREPGRRGGAARRDARRRPAGRELGLDLDALRFHHRSECDGGGELEGRRGELPRVLPLRGRAPGVQPRSSTCRPDAYRLEVGGVHLEPDRPGARRRRRAASSTSSGRTRKINVFPGEPNLSIGPIVPAGAGAHGSFPRLLLRRGRGRAWIAELLELDDQVGREDTALVERVQTGVASGALAEGRCSARRSCSSRISRGSCAKR